MRITREERARTGDDGIIAVCFVKRLSALNLIPHKFIIITFNKKGADTVLYYRLRLIIYLSISANFSISLRISIGLDIILISV